MTTISPTVIAPGAASIAMLGGFGIDWKIDGAVSSGRFSVVHHPLAPKALGAPLHRHHREDEYSFVLSGKLGALLGDDVVFAEPGTWVFKPRGQWHSFWNAADAPCEIIELISPAGFEHYFRELAAIWPDLSRIGPLLEKYELDMDPASVPVLCERFGLAGGPKPIAA
ncbi:MAG: cupin domain-containing protein [Devosia sp.]|jgi:mannose-6-phosphate isomerase-like protein (cupin superfamily)